MSRLFVLSLLVITVYGCGGGGGGGGGEPVPETPPREITPPSPDTVTTACGVFQGQELADTVAFKGIAYAKPPTGERRWQPPAPVDCVDSTQPVVAFESACAQLDDSGNVISSSEDCLYLNLWTPAQSFPATARRPVLFFIHGGGNQRGSPDTEQLGVTLYDGAALAASEGVVVVTVGYRLGALGFMSHPALAAENSDGRAGNYGLLDQVAALQWVQEHIADFGGDPERVAIFGESGGARDVCSLVASPLANGLFSGAIMQSGGCRQRTQVEAESEGVTIAEAVGCVSRDNSECLRAASAEELLAALGPEEARGAFVGQNIGPVVDGYVLLDSPERVIEQGAHNQVPLIIGANTEETGRWVQGGSGLISEATYEALVRSQFGAGLGNLILTRYPASDYASPADAYVALSTDSQFICPARSIASAGARHSQPVYVYRFAKSFENTALQAAGAFHGIELFYIFQKVSELASYTPTAGDTAVEALMANLWSGFAASGDPNNGDAGNALQWTPYSEASDTVLLIDATLSEVTEPRAAQCDFWQSFEPS